MESRGKTILVVHHALRTVPLYFDHVAMINRRLIAAGSVRDVFTEENIEKLFLRRKESDHGTGRFLCFTFMAGLYISNRPGRNDYLRRTLRRGGIFYRPPQGSASGGRYFPFVLSGDHAGFLFLGVKHWKAFYWALFCPPLPHCPLSFLPATIRNFLLTVSLPPFFPLFRRGSRSVFHHPAYRKCQPVWTESIYFRTGIHYSLPRRPSHRIYFYFTLS